jgi:hypothetical protein
LNFTIVLKEFCFNLDRDRCEKLSEKFDVDCIPFLTVLSPSLEIVVSDGVKENVYFGLVNPRKMNMYGKMLIVMNVFLVLYLVLDMVVQMMSVKLICVKHVFKKLNMNILFLNFSFQINNTR